MGSNDLEVGPRTTGAGSHTSSMVEDPDTWDTKAYDLDERRRDLLTRIDGAKFSWFHIQVCLVAGAG